MVRDRQKLIPILFSFLVSILLLFIKFFIYWKTRSVAILSDAMESVINVIATGVAVASIIVSSKPPDESHPYGHGKAEYFSAGFEGALILFAAYGIMYLSYKRFTSPVQILSLDLGLAGTLLVVLINGLLGWWLISKGKKEGSIALEADGKHVLTDAYTSLGVLLSFLLIKITGRLWLDPIFAFFIALNIIYMGIRLVLGSLKGLMQAKDPKLLREIERVLKRHRSITHIEIHQLRAWRAGKDLFVDFHLTLPQELPLYKAHKEAKRLSNILKAKFGQNTHVMVQLDPCGERYCDICEKNLMALNSKEQSLSSTWKGLDLTQQRHPL